MTCFVYIIQSKKDGRFYIGSTNNLTERVKRHNKGRSKYTKPKLPWKLIYHEKHTDRSRAVKRENQIKRRKKKNYIESLVRPSRQ